MNQQYLLQVLPPVGYRVEWKAVLGFLKIAAGATLEVWRSELECLDGSGRSLDRTDNAFGLNRGARLVGPFSERLREEESRPDGAVVARWTLNEFCVETPLLISAQELRAPRVVFLPLQVCLPRDVHVIVTITNQGRNAIDIARAMQEAACWMDGVRYPGVAARTWNGPYLLSSNRSTTRQFRLVDFPDVPRHGLHETSFEILGVRSPTHRVEWSGEPWLA